MYKSIQDLLPQLLCILTLCIAQILILQMYPKKVLLHKIKLLHCYTKLGSLVNNYPQFSFVFLWELVIFVSTTSLHTHSTVCQNFQPIYCYDSSTVAVNRRYPVFCLHQRAVIGDLFFFLMYPFFSVSQNPLEDF